MTDIATEQARLEALNARARLSQTLGDIQDKLAPASIAQNAIDGFRDKAGEAATAIKARPAVAAAAIGAIALFLGRKPLTRALTKRFSKSGETEAAAGGSAPDRPRTARGVQPKPASEETSK